MWTIVKRLRLSAPRCLHMWVRCGRPRPDERGHPARPVRLVPWLLLSSVALTTAMEGETLARRQLRDRSPTRSRLSGFVVPHIRVGAAWAVPGQSLHPARVLQRHPRHPVLTGKLKLGGVSLCPPPKGARPYITAPLSLYAQPGTSVSPFSLGLSCGSCAGLPQPSYASHCSTSDDATPGVGAHSGQRFPPPKDRSQKGAQLSVLSSRLSVSLGDQGLSPEEGLGGMSQCPLQFLTPQLPYMTPG